MFCWPITACGHADDGVSFLDLFQALQLIISWLQRHGDLSTSFLRWICWASKIHGVNWDDQSWLPWATSTSDVCPNFNGEIRRDVKSSSVGRFWATAEPRTILWREVELDPKCQKFHPPNQWSVPWDVHVDFSLGVSRHTGNLVSSHLQRLFQTGWDFERSRAQWSFPPNRVVEDFRCGKHGSTACPEWRPVRWRYSALNGERYTNQNNIIWQVFWYFNGIGTISWRVLHGFLTIPKI